jgi:protein-disulfide isomerase
MRLPLVFAFLLLAMPAFAQAPLAAAPVPGQPDAGAASLPDQVMGDPAAPVTLIEYASLTCPHCAHFANEILPKLTEKYIATGKVKLIYRDFPLDGLSLHAAQLAQCLPQERYFTFIKSLFANQEKWLAAADPEATLKQYAKLAGLGNEKVDSCLADKNLEKALVARRMYAAEKFKVDATPMFVVNYGAENISGAKDFEDFEKVLKKYVK